MQDVGPEQERDRVAGPPGIALKARDVARIAEIEHAADLARRDRGRQRRGIERRLVGDQVELADLLVERHAREEGLDTLVQGAGRVGRPDRQRHARERHDNRQPARPRRQACHSGRRGRAFRTAALEGASGRTCRGGPRQVPSRFGVQDHHAEIRGARRGRVMEPHHRCLTGQGNPESDQAAPDDLDRGGSAPAPIRHGTPSGPVGVYRIDRPAACRG